MQSDRNDRRKDVAPGQPGENDRAHRFQTEHRRKPEENPDRHPAGNRPGCVANGQQPDRMFLKPAAQVHSVTVAAPSG